MPTLFPWLLLCYEWVSLKSSGIARECLESMISDDCDELIESYIMMTRNGEARGCQGKLMNY